MVPVHVIVGAAGGIGSATARLLRHQGATVVLAGRRLEPLQALADEIGAVAVMCDATEPADIASLMVFAKEQYGRVDGATACVGSILLKPAHLTTDADWSDTIQRNLTAAFNLVREATRAMMDTGGSIVLLASGAATIGITNHEAIAAAKAGVIGLGRSAAATYAPRNIRVNVVAPGLVRSAMSARLTSSEAAVKASLALHPLGRLGEPGDVARAVAFFLDPQNSWITGQCLGVDGGLASLKGRV